MIDPNESPWLKMARELGRNPDSPASLSIMSSVNAALQHSQQAVDQLVDAIATQIELPGDRADAGVLAATRHWEAVCRGVLDAGTLELFRADARELLKRRARQPPRLESVIEGVSGRTDTGYTLGVHLDGLRGTWHRLWAIIVLFKSEAGEGSLDDWACELRTQFEDRLGRKMTTAEWAQLEQHATRRAEAISAERARPE
jgi:hypothetical protein